MAEILSSVASELVKSLASLAIDELKFLKGVPAEIQRLRERLERILPVISAADSRRLKEGPEDVWVKQLREVVYDAEDVIQGCMLKAKKSSLLLPTIGGLRRHKIGNKIRDINQSLDKIIQDIGILGLIPADRSSGSGVDRRIISRDTSHLVEPDLVGETIEDDAAALVNMLVSFKGNQTQSRISVFAIVGMGGIGKTTLAQKIFNDGRITAQFHGIKPIWICVSEDFSDIDVLRAIITDLGGYPREHRRKEILEPMLAEIVKDRRFFLVLDDVWDARVWELLYKPLHHCSEGSRVLVTTRHDHVATGMKAVHRHQVRRLSDEDGWLLIRNNVLRDDKDVADLQANLRDVGMKIVKKCDGLPLALKVIAGVLRNEEMTQRRWEGVLQKLSGSSPMLPPDVSSVLCLSYTELPSHLKQCFIYFALFPEDFLFKMECVIHMWIAEGFVEVKGDMLMEELGRSYWEELVHRSLLQPQSIDLRYCKVHDLLRSLARFLASDECSCLDKHELGKHSLHRLHMKSSVESISDVITHQVSLRTLSIPFLKKINDQDATRLKCLRLLSLEGSFVDNLPNSIGDLIYLRYLNLSNTPIKKIPESIGNLVNLQSLILAHCGDLHNLPNSVVNLCSLRCLALNGTDLHSMPVGMGRLSNLVTLWGFMVYGNKKDSRDAKIPEHCSLEELGSLSQILDLNITKLEDTPSSEVARAAALKDKLHLTELSLECEPCNSDENIKKIGEVFEELCPPPCIENLIIQGYFGRECPSWMVNSPSSFLRNLKDLYLENCALTEQLPPLGLLPQLVHLAIKGASAVKIIGPQFFGVDEDAYTGRSFPKLKQLRFKDMPNWEEWSWLREEENDDKIHEVLPRLQLLYIERCPKLKALPLCLQRHAPALTDLLILGSHSLKRIENLHHVEKLWVNHSSGLERISNLPALKELKLRVVNREFGDGGKLKITESFNSLCSVELSGIEMESLPEGLEEARFLRKLVIHCVSLLLLSRCLQGGPEWHKIKGIACFDAYENCDVKGTGFYIHYTRSPFSFDTNITFNHFEEISSNNITDLLNVLRERGMMDLANEIADKEGESSSNATDVAVRYRVLILQESSSNATALVRVAREIVDKVGESRNSITTALVHVVREIVDKVGESSSSITTD